MIGFETVKPEEFNKSVFKLIGKDWMLISAKAGEKVNAMTASWGGMGVMWGRNVVYVVIRPSRYTKELVDKSGCFALNFFGGDYREKLNYMGSASGRNEDKISKAGFSVAECKGKPYFEQSEIAVMCKTLYKQELTRDGFEDMELDVAWYPQKDYHTLYVAEIEEILVKTH